MNFEIAADQAQALAQEILDDGCGPVEAQALGLDPRAGHNLMVDEERTFIACHIARRAALEYYGGFEYVGEEHRMQIGDWMFYSAGCERVEGHLDCLREACDEA